MIVTTVSVHVKAEHLPEFIEATLENHRCSVLEPGNLRFDILQCLNDPTRFTFYEAYESPEAVAAHKDTPHYLKWRDAVADWMASPRSGTAHQVLAPLEMDQWQ